jgi:hypothetical protein
MAPLASMRQYSSESSEFQKHRDVEYTQLIED